MIIIAATKVNGQAAPISPAWATMKRVAIIAIILKMITLFFSHFHYYFSTF